MSHMSRLLTVDFKHVLFWPGVSARHGLRHRLNHIGKCADPRRFTYRFTFQTKTLPLRDTLRLWKRFDQDRSTVIPIPRLSFRSSKTSYRLSEWNIINDHPRSILIHKTLWRISRVIIVTIANISIIRMINHSGFTVL